MEKEGGNEKSHPGWGGLLSTVFVWGVLVLEKQAYCIAATCRFIGFRRISWGKSGMERVVR